MNHWIFCDNSGQDSQIFQNELQAQTIVIMDTNTSELMIQNQHVMEFSAPCLQKVDESQLMAMNSKDTKHIGYNGFVSPRGKVNHNHQLTCTVNPLSMM